MPGRVLGSLPEGFVVVLSAPAGTGKTTLVRRLTSEYSCVEASISYTTREPRSGEIPGVHYQYVTKQEFETKIAQDDFLEYVCLYGDYYGTSRSWVESRLKSGKHVVLVIDTQGAAQLRPKLKAVFIFVKPPSLQELRRRLTQRGTENVEVIETRLAWAAKEIEAALSYDYLIVNDDLETAYQVLKSILIAEEHRV